MSCDVIVEGGSGYQRVVLARSAGLAWPRERRGKPSTSGSEVESGNVCLWHRRKTNPEARDRRPSKPKPHMQTWVIPPVMNLRSAEGFLTALTLVAGAPSLVAAQGRTVDEGTFVISRNGA